MKVRYLGPADRLVIGATRIRRNEVGEISKAEYDALGSKQNRLEVIPPVRASRSRKPASRRKPAAHAKE